MCGKNGGEAVQSTAMNPFCSESAITGTERVAANRASLLVNVRPYTAIRFLLGICTADWGQCGRLRITKIERRFYSAYTL